MSLYLCLPFIFLGSNAGLDYSPIRKTSQPVFEKARMSILKDVYREYIQDIVETEDGIIFKINGDTIFFQNGKLLSDSRLRDTIPYGSLFYLYPRGRISKIPLFKDKTRVSADFWESLFGNSEKDVRKHCKSGRFLDHFVFLNRVCHEPLKAVEQQILEAAGSDPLVQEFLDDLDIIYSFQQRKTKGYKQNISLHSFGLALDLVPRSYKHKQVFWRWSRVFYRDNWHNIPLKKRWSPPQAVIDAFEDNGFAWGGKWVHFDTIHFEYRPEIVLPVPIKYLDEMSMQSTY